MGLDWTPELVAVDADGTIVGADEIVPPPLAAKLRQIDRLGVPVVLVTGRSWLSAQLVIDQLRIPHMYCVCNNGATVATYPPLRVIRQERFDPAPIVEVVRAHPSVLMAVEAFGRGYDVSRPFPPGGVFCLHGRIEVASFDDLAARPVSRIILWDPVASPDQFAAFVDRLDLDDLFHVQEGTAWLDLGSSRTGKQYGLAAVAAEIGVDRDAVLAIGDGANDIEFLRWAGRGVALGDAPDQLKAVADDVTGTFSAGGALTELKKWFPDE